MRIANDFEEQVSREVLARRASMLAELSARTARTTAGIRETPPAVHSQGDEVHISPEARAAAWAKAPAPVLPLRAFPSPADVVEALRSLVELLESSAPHAPLDKLGQLLAGLARGLPGEAPSTPSSATTILADAVVRAFLGEAAVVPAPATAARAGFQSAPGEALRAARELLAAVATPSAGQQTVLERATAALVLAVLRWRGPSPVPPPVSGQPGEPFPASLLSLVAQPGAAPRRQRRRGRERTGLEGTVEPDIEEGEQPAGDYRSSPRRT